MNNAAVPAVFDADNAAACPQFSGPTMCRNPECNNRTRFSLDLEKSRFVDYQKLRIQETQAELPRGSIPRR